MLPSLPALRVTTFLLPLLLAVTPGFTTGCRMAPIHNVVDAPLRPPAGRSLTAEDVQKAIQAAGERLTWRMQDVRPGEMTGTLTMNARHVAVVSITYDSSAFSIRYKESKLLMQQGNEIHKNYNASIMKLEAAIQQEVARVGPSQ